jgi:DUF1365 family protein
MIPAGHEFVYRMFMVYLDLAELDQVFKGRWFWSVRRPALGRFRRENHLGEQGVPLEQSVRDLVEEQTGIRPRGPVRLLTNLSYFGYCFNPVSFYYCFDALDECVETIVAEVNNTPWGERHAYVLSESMNSGAAGHKQYRPAKQMHVSPFMVMDVDYDWRFSSPGNQLSVHMQNSRQGQKIFDATLVLKRSEISSWSLARVLITHPLMTVKIITAIHWQALRLWLKGVPVHDHPDKAGRLERTEI